MANVSTIAISFDRKQAGPGEVITGKVLLIAPSEVACTSIGCRIIGQENTSVLYKTTSHSGEDETTHFHTAQETRTFVDFSFSAQHFPNGKVLPGQYEFPFKFTVPHECPPSLTAGDQNSHCGILYHMEARLDHSGVMKHDIRHKQEFTVVSPAPITTKNPAYIEPSSKELRTMNLMNRGKVLIGGMAENSTLVAGETTVVKCAVQNQSSLRLRAIKISLVEVVSIRAQGQSTTQVTKLFRKRLAAEDCPLDLSPMRGNVDEDQARRAVNDLLSSDAMKLEVTVPITARSHYAGGLISISHELTIKVCTPFGTSNPQVSRAVYVNSRGAPIAPHRDEGHVVAQPVGSPTIAVPYEEYQGKHVEQVYAIAASLAVAQPLSEKHSE